MITNETILTNNEYFYIKIYGILGFLTAFKSLFNRIWQLLISNYDEALFAIDSFDSKTFLTLVSFAYTFKKDGRKSSQEYWIQFSILIE